MKTLFRVFTVTMFVAAAGVISASAQEDKCPDLAACVAIFRAEIKKPCGERAQAIEVGEFIGVKFAADTDNAALIKRIADRAVTMKAEDVECIRISTRNTSYDTAYKGKNWEEFFRLSKEIAADPKTDPGLQLDIMLSMVGAGLELAIAKNDKFNAETVQYGKLAIQKINSGLVSKLSATSDPKDMWGTFDPFKGKEESLSWMNYTVGFLLMKMSRQDEAISFMYDATKYAPKKSDWTVYRSIALWYAEKANAHYTDYTKIFEANGKVENDETKAKLALARGWAERAVDAYGRAQRMVADAKIKASLGESVTEYYKFRFNGKVEGQDKFVADLLAKPMPDPSSAVTPAIIEETASTTPTTVTPTTTQKPATTPTKPTTQKPATTPTKPTSSTVKPAASTTVKKPVVKKKATR